MLTYDTETSLRSKFDLICDEKYKNGEKDDDYRRAVETVKTQVGLLKTEALEKKGKVETVREAFETVSLSLVLA